MDLSRHPKEPKHDTENAITMMTQSYRRILLRIIIDLALLTGAFLFPYWLVIITAMFVAVFVPYYVEFIVLVVIEEALYHASSSGAGLLFPLGLIAAFILLEAGRTITRDRFLRI
jgi:hypothetical protein